MRVNVVIFPKTSRLGCVRLTLFRNWRILGLQPISGDPKDNGVAAMLDDRTFCFVIQHGRHAFVFLDLQGLVANQEYIQYVYLFSYDQTTHKFFCGFTRL